MTYTEDLHPDYQITISPLIRELNPELYTGCGITIEKFNPTLIISKDVQNLPDFKNSGRYLCRGVNGR